MVPTVASDPVLYRNYNIVMACPAGSLHESGQVWMQVTLMPHWLIDILCDVKDQTQIVLKFKG